MNHFDKAARYAAKLDPVGFFTWLVPECAGVWTFRHWLDTRTLPFPGAPDRTCDTVARFDLHTASRVPYALVTEFQTEPDPYMLERLLEYAARLRSELRHGRRGRYRVAVALLNLTGPRQESVLDMTLPGLAEVGIRMGVRQRTMREEDAAQTLAAIGAGRTARCLLPWIPLMHGASDPAIITEWRRLVEAEPHGRLRADFVGLALVFAELVRHKGAWKTGLEGLNMRVSKQVLEWQEEARVETRRTDLLTALEVRFGAPVPADLAAEIVGLKNLDELARWFRVSLGVSSLAEFREAIGLES
jgi:hypothetical protein